MKKLSFLLIIILIFQICLLRLESEDDLSPINLTGFEEDYHRVNEAIHYAHMLADLGAGYEAARVLASIASRAANTDFGNHAHQILDFLLKDHGRIIYDCNENDWERGKCKPTKNHENH